MKKYEKPVVEIIDFKVIEFIMDEEDDLIPSVSDEFEEW